MSKQQPGDTSGVEYLRERYRSIMRQIDEDYISRATALELVTVCIMLGEAGYVLNEDESDWIPQPPAAGE